MQITDGLLNGAFPVLRNIYKQTMAAGKYSFVIEQGSTFQLELQYKDSAGSAVSLVGYSSVPPKPYFYDGTSWNALY